MNTLILWEGGFNIKEKCIKISGTIIILVITVKLLTDVIFANYVVLNVKEKDLNKIITFWGESVYICAPAEGLAPEWIVLGDEKGFYENQSNPKRHKEETLRVNIDNLNIGLLLSTDETNRVKSLFGNTIVIVARNKGKRRYHMLEEYTVLKPSRVYILNKN